MPALPQDLVDATVTQFLAEEVISPGITSAEFDKRREAATSEARKAKATAERQERQAAARLEQAELKWLDGKLADERYESLRDKFEGERRQAAHDAKTAAATIDALANPDPDAVAAVDRLRADITKATADPDALAAFRGLVVKVFDSFEIIRAPADTDPQIEGFPTPSFLYKRPAVRDGGDREHRYFLLPNVRPELAEIYGDLPLVGAPSELIARNGLPWRVARGPR